MHVFECVCAVWREGMEVLSVLFSIKQQSDSDITSTLPDSSLAL